MIGSDFLNTEEENEELYNPKTGLPSKTFCKNLQCSHFQIIVKDKEAEYCKYCGQQLCKSEDNDVQPPSGSKDNEKTVKYDYFKIFKLEPDDLKKITKKTLRYSFILYLIFIIIAFINVLVKYWDRSHTITSLINIITKEFYDCFILLGILIACVFILSIFFYFVLVYKKCKS